VTSLSADDSVDGILVQHPMPAHVDLPRIVADADIVVAAVGLPELIKGAWIKPGSVVIDTG
jgi:5,10-methylene-tetrahydrofolate dehydrogenase/methenyl tetrahydrofolate cyclohydrolase